MSPEDLPIAEFAFPGPFRDRLVAAILALGPLHPAVQSAHTALAAAS